MEALLQAHLDFLAEHLYALVFGAFIIEAAGVPFPSRILLVVAATLAERKTQLPLLVMVSALGAVIGDHVPYTAGKLTGPKLLVYYCRFTLSSERCVERTLAYFARFGAMAVVLSRFSASIRILASVLSGCGHITYGRFITWDVVGSIVYATVWVTVGYLIGDQAADLMRRYGAARLVVLIGPVVLLGVVASRLWRRARERRMRPAAATTVQCATEDLTVATDSRDGASEERTLRASGCAGSC